jgi:acyl-CoA thioesterase-1
MRELTVGAVLLTCAAACGGSGSGPAPASRAAGPAPQPVHEADSATLRVVVLGDSLAAGLGLSDVDAFPAVMERRLRDEGFDVDVINAGVSGDTTATGLARLGGLLASRPDIVVIELGANDAMLGRDVDDVEANLREAVARVRKSGAIPLLVGIEVPEVGYATVAEDYRSMFRRLSADGTAVVPSLLLGVAGRVELNQEDGLHPNAGGQEILATNVLKGLRPLVAKRLAPVPP